MVGAFDCADAANDALVVTTHRQADLGRDLRILRPSRSTITITSASGRPLVRRGPYGSAILSCLCGQARLLP